MIMWKLQGKIWNVNWKYLLGFIYNQKMFDTISICRSLNVLTASNPLWTSSKNIHHLWSNLYYLKSALFEILEEQNSLFLPLIFHLYSAKSEFNNLREHWLDIFLSVVCLIKFSGLCSATSCLRESRKICSIYCRQFFFWDVLCPKCYFTKST